MPQLNVSVIVKIHETIHFRVTAPNSRPDRIRKISTNRFKIGEQPAHGLSTDAKIQASDTPRTGTHHQPDFTFVENIRIKMSRNIIHLTRKLVSTRIAIVTKSTLRKVYELSEPEMKTLTNEQRLAIPGRHDSPKSVVSICKKMYAVDFWMQPPLSEW